MKKILIIEDDSIVAHIYRSRLEKEGYAVEVATDGQTGYYRIHDLRPDGILLDLMLPKMNGVEILKKIRAQAQFQKIPVVVFTNAYVTNMIQESFTAGASRFAAASKSSRRAMAGTFPVASAVSCSMISLSASGECKVASSPNAARNHRRQYAQWHQNNRRQRYPRIIDILPKNINDRAAKLYPDPSGRKRGNHKLSLSADVQQPAPKCHCNGQPRKDQRRSVKKHVANISNRAERAADQQPQHAGQGPKPTQCPTGQPNNQEPVVLSFFWIHYFIDSAGFAEIPTTKPGTKKQNNEDAAPWWHNHPRAARRLAGLITRLERLFVHIFPDPTPH